MSSMATIESVLSPYETLLAEYQNLKDRYRHSETYIECLEEALRLMRYRQFAPKSEKFITDEQLIFDEIEVAAKDFKPDDESDQPELIEVAAHTKQKPRRNKLPKDLPRETVTIELPFDERVCPHDGTELKVIGKEVSERIDVVPMQMKVIETHRLTYACPCCESHVKTAQTSPEIVPKGKPTAGTLAFIATAKFVDGLSLYHIEKMFERNGVDISRGSQAHWMIRCHLAALPLLNLLEEDLLSRDYVQMDETPVQVLKEEGKKPESLSYMWIRACPGIKPIVLFDYDPSRKGEVAQRLLMEFKGKLQCDGFSGYDILEKTPRIERYGCMAHGRRKLYEAVKSQKSANIAKHALKLVQRLYKIEDEVRGSPSDHVFAVRQEKSVSILNALREWIDQNMRRVPPKSPTGKSLLYLHNEWPYLAKYVGDGRVHIDNNFIENKIRPFAVGRRRWLFSDSVEGARASAALYSLVETTKANGIEPYKYLRHAFERLPKAQTLADFEELLPWNAKI